MLARLDTDQLKIAIGEAEYEAIVGNPGYAEGGVAIAYGPSINVITPVPVAPGEVLDIPEFQAPTSTGAAPVVVNVGPFINVIPGTAPTDYAVYSVKAQDFTQGTGGWQGTSISEADLKAENGSVAIIEAAWEQAHINLGGYGGTAVSGTHLHSEVKSILEAQGFDGFLELSMSSDGNPEADYGEKGSIRLDVFEVKGDTLYIYDFKAGGATLSQTRINEIKTRASEGATNGNIESIDKIVVIEVKL